MFKCIAKTMFSSLEYKDDDLDNHSLRLKKMWQETSDDVLGRNASNRKE